MTAVAAGDVERVTKAYLRNENRIVQYTLPAAPAGPVPPAAAKPKAQ